MHANNELLSSIATLLDLREMDAIEISMLKTLRQVLAVDWGAIYHLDAQGKIEFSEGLVGDDSIDDEADDRFAGLLDSDSAVQFPIVIQSRDTVALLRIGRVPQLNDAEMLLLTGLLRIYDNYVAVLRQSQTDRLTGLLNRHTFDIQLGRALDLIRAQYRAGAVSGWRRRDSFAQGSFWVGAIDIDHFKRINDTFGHLYGDEVLLLLAQILKSTFRRTDLIYRFGGEEFVAIVFVESIEDARRIFERLRQRVETYAFPSVGQVTVSVGVAAIGASSAPVELLGCADQALYYAKRNGRNQVCFYDDLIAENKIAAPQGGGITYF
jgi:diguanylate cyclase (GGDEF)-like protein